MTSLFYFYTDGRRRGPYTEQQLKILAAQGDITPTTPIETDSGHKRPAEQIKGLFPESGNPENARRGRYYYYESGEKIGPIRGKELRQLVLEGRITRETILEDREGRTCPAKNASGLTFPETPVPSPFSQPVEALPLTPKPVFCTNCGKSVAELAGACMLCGAKPTGHKKFCRQCGVGLNPEQVVCIRCGVAFAGNSGMPWADAANLISSTAANLISGTSVPLDAQQRKARIHFWTVLCMISSGIVALATIYYGYLEYHTSEVQQEVRKNSPRHYYYTNADRRASEAQIEEAVEERLGQIAFALLVITGIPYLFCYYFYLRRLWEEIPGEFAQTTPGNAAGLALIPVFHLYWMFTAFCGLYVGMRKTMESYGLEPRFNESRIKQVCIAWVILFLGEIRMTWETSGNPEKSGSLATVFAIFGAVLTIPVYWYIRKNVLEFIDIKSSVGK